MVVEVSTWGLPHAPTTAPDAGTLAATRRAVARGADDAWLVQDGLVTEACAATAHIVTADGVLVTRELSHALLPGVTRASVLELADGQGIRVEERAFTPDDAKAIKQTVKTYPNTEYDLEKLLTELGTGEAVVTVLSERGTPTPVAWTMLRAPQSRMAPADQGTLDQLVAGSTLAGRYAEAVDRESAYEILAQRLKDADAPEVPAGTTPAPQPAPAPQRAPEPDKGIVEQVVESSAFRSAMRSAGTVIGREITRSLFGTAQRRRR